MVDAIAKAKDMQWNINFINDPVEASLKGADALGELTGIDDPRLRSGQGVIVSTKEAYMLRQWDEDEHRFVNMQYGRIVALGMTIGRMAFVQNLVSNPYLQTIVLPVNEASIFPQHGSVDEDDNDVDTTSPINTVRIPRLIIPILEIEDIRVAA